MLYRSLAHIFLYHNMLYRQIPLLYSSTESTIVGLLLAQREDLQVVRSNRAFLFQGIKALDTISLRSFSDFFRGHPNSVK